MKKNKRAFTLLEVLLAVAILLISSTVIFQGFMATLGYSANTAIFANDGAYNTSKAYTEINAKKGKNKENGADGVQAKWEAVGGGGTYYTVKVFSSKTHSNGAEDVVSDVADDHLSSNRYAITYALPKGLVCPDCSSSENLVRDKNDSGNGYRWYCKACHPADTVYVGLPEENP